MYHNILNGTRIFLRIVYNSFIFSWKKVLSENIKDICTKNLIV